MLKKAVLLTVPFAFALVLGCDPLTRTHYDIIVVDVANEMDVQHSIGDPTYRRPNEWHYERPDQHLNVIVDFNSEGIVTRKQWIDAKSGDWADTKEKGDTSSHERTTIRTINK